MSKADSDLDFNVLLKRVLHCWPKSINVAELSVYGRPDLYVVNGLGGAMRDSIEERLDGEIDAVLVTTLCGVVFSTIRSAALFCTEIKPAFLRAETVRENFEKQLHQVKTMPDLGWSVDDNLLIDRYFSLNSQ